MKRILSMMLVTCFAATFLSAQEKNEKKKCSCSFRSLNQAGILVGETETSYQFQTINGLAWNQWFAGLGLGLDGYVYRSVPLFLQVERTLLKRKSSPYILVSGGIHFPWVNYHGSFGEKINYVGGPYYNLGGGYRFGLNHNHALQFSIAYSFKQMQEQHYSTYYCLTGNCPDEISGSRKYLLRRVSFQFGFAF